MRSRILALVVVLALVAELGRVACAPLVHAATGETGAVLPGADCYRIDRQTAAFRPTLSSADTLTAAAILATTDFDCSGGQNARTTIAVGGRFSASGATCKIRLAYVYKSPAGTSTIKGYSQELTLSGGTTQFAAAYYPAPDALFDSEGATNVRVLITGATSPGGTVDLWVGSY